jgi:hypothetical protein
VPKHVVLATRPAVNNVLLAKNIMNIICKNKFYFPLISRDSGELRAARPRFDSPQVKQIFLFSTVFRPAPVPSQPPSHGHGRGVPRSRMVEVYLHSPICLHCAVFNCVGGPLYLPPPLLTVSSSPSRRKIMKSVQTPPFLLNAHHHVSHTRVRVFLESKQLTQIRSVLTAPAHCLSNCKLPSVRGSFPKTLRPLVASSPPRQPGFDPKSGHVEFVDKMVLGQASSEYFRFPCQFSFHQMLPYSSIIRGWFN